MQKASYVISSVVGDNEKTKAVELYVIYGSNHVHGGRRQIEGVVRRILCQELAGLLQHALLIKQQAAAAADGDDNDDDVDDADATVLRLSSCANDLLCIVRYYQAGGTVHPCSCSALSVSSDYNRNISVAES